MRIRHHSQQEVHEHFLLSIEVNVLSRANRTTRWVAQAKLSALEQNTRLAMFH